jgi:hypothetical protein
MTAYNIDIQEFMKLLKEIKAKGHKLVDVEIKEDATLYLKGVEGSKEEKTNKKISDTDWEQTV